MFKKQAIAVLVSTVCVVGAWAAEKSVQLETVSVVAREPAALAKSAQDVVQLGQPTLAASQAVSVADVLKYVPSVDITGGSRAVAQKPSIRGLSGNRVVQVVDGVRQNFELAHRGSFFVPMSFVQELEVLKGANSTLWGSGALGGVVAMRTPTAHDLLEEGQSFGAKVHHGYQSANRLSDSNVTLYTANDKLDLLLSGVYQDAAKDQKLGSGERLANSTYIQRGGLAKVGVQLNDHHRIELSHRLNAIKQTAPSNNEAAEELTNESMVTEIGMWHRANGALARSNPQAYMAAMQAFYAGLASRLGNVSYVSDQEILDQSTVLNYYFDPESALSNGQLSVYRNETKEQERRVVSGLQDQTRLTTTGVNLRNSSEVHGITLTYGADYAQDKAHTVRSTNQSDGQFRPNGYDAKANTHAGYLLAHIPLGERVTFSPSVRYDHYQAKKRNNGTSYSESRWSPAAALTWTASEWLELSARYHEAFRAPSMAERFTSGSHFGVASARGNSVNKFVANPHLKAETAKNKEIGAKLQFHSLLTEQDKLQFKATYFQNDVKDFINLEVYKANDREFLPSISQYQNVKNARLSGVELVAEYQLEGLKLMTAYAQTRGKDKQTQQALSNVAADKWVAAVDYALLKDELTVGARVARYASQKRVPQGQTAYAGYTLTDLTAGYTPRQLKNLRIDVAVENLFNKSHQPAFSLMEGTGRNVKLGATYKF